MARLIHLNGPPAVGKSTLAHRYGMDHAGTLVCEIDSLRTMVAGWDADLMEAGMRIRTAALALMTAYLHEGGDVVVPQLVADPEQLTRFAKAAEDGGATYVHVVLTAPADEVVRRFRGRGAEHPWAAALRDMVDSHGGDDFLREWVAAFDRLEGMPVATSDPDTTYRALLVALDATA